MAKPANNPILHVTDLHKAYQMGPAHVDVLSGVDLNVAQGEWLAVLGRSGSGKSTLLHLVGGLDDPDLGEVTFREQSVFNQPTRQRDRYRHTHVGFVFQFYHLLPELSVVENVTVAAMIGRSVMKWPLAYRGVHQRAIELLDRVDLSHRLRHHPSELSGGERQRVAIARALINQPDLLLADEPTGNLDRKTGNTILDMIAEFHRQGQTIIMVTHDANVADRADRVLTLESGRLKK